MQLENLYSMHVVDLHDEALAVDGLIRSPALLNEDAIGEAASYSVASCWATSSRRDHQYHL